jgi:RNA polymerase sigma-70 factor (ECF subfamily)
MLQVVVGIDAARIASAFLVAPATMSQRLVRAKAKLASAEIPLHVPPDADLSNRLDSVLEAIYAAFSQDDSNATDPRTRGLAVEALWLGGLLANLCPNEPEALGLLALMQYAAARNPARRDAAGRYVPLDEQDVSRWDSAAIERAEAVLERAAGLRRIGRFQLEAAIQSAHMAKRFRFEPDWKAIVMLYDDLLARTASPVVALNRAIALGRLQGARAGLDALCALASESRLQGYQPYWAGRAHLSAAAGDLEPARAEYMRAIGLTVDPSVRNFLESRLARLAIE